MTPALLLNENIPAQSVALLRTRAIDLLVVSDTQPGLTDLEVLKIAVREGRWIVTFDRDYGELIFGRGLASPPAILLLREQHYALEDPAGWVLEVLRQPEQFLGKFVTHSRQAIRTRALP